MLRLQLPRGGRLAWSTAMSPSSPRRLATTKTAATGPKYAFIWKKLRESAVAMGLERSEAWMLRQLTRQLVAIHADAVKPCNQPVTGTTDFDFLCSYTWGQDAICVPGDAPHLALRDLPVVMRPRDGQTLVHYRDANLALSPDGPWRPMFHALDIMQPGLKLDDVDIIINRNVLQALLTFVAGNRRKSPFRLDLSMVKNTLVVTPVLRRAVEGQTDGMGRVFEHLFTQHATPAQQGSHHRVIRYDIGPLRCLVMFECDAQVDDVSLSSLGRTQAAGFAWSKPPDCIGGQELHDRVAQQLQSRSENERRQFDSLSTRPGPRPRGEGRYKVLRDGQGTLSSQLAELVTVSAQRSSIKGKKTAQMWLGRTPFLVVGKRYDDVMKKLVTRPAWPHLLEFEKSHQDALRRLVSVIRELKHWASASPGQSCGVVSAGQEESLRIFARIDTTPVRHSLRSYRSRFWTRPWVAAPTKKANRGDILYKQDGVSRPLPKKDISIVEQQRARNAAIYTIKELQDNTQPGSVT